MCIFFNYDAFYCKFDCSLFVYNVKRCLPLSERFLYAKTVRANCFVIKLNTTKA